MWKTPAMTSIFVMVIVFLAGIGRAQWWVLVLRSVLGGAGVGLTILGARWSIHIFVKPPSDMDSGTGFGVLGGGGEEEPDLTPLKKALEEETEDTSTATTGDSETTSSESPSESSGSSGESESQEFEEGMEAEDLEEPLSEAPPPGEQAEGVDEEGAQELAGLISETIQDEESQ